MQKLGNLTSKSDAVTEVDAEITQSSNSPIASSAVYQLSSEFIGKLGEIDVKLDDVLG